MYRLYVTKTVLIVLKVVNCSFNDKKAPACKTGALFVLHK